MAHDTTVAGARNGRWVGVDTSAGIPVQRADKPPLAKLFRDSDSCQSLAEGGIVADSVVAGVDAEREQPRRPFLDANVDPVDRLIDVAPQL